MPVSIAVSNPPPNRLFDWALDPLVFPTVGATAPNMVDRITGRSVAFGQQAGGAGRAFNLTLQRDYIAFAGVVGAYGLPLAPAFAIPPNNASATDPVHIYGVQVFATTGAALPAAGADQGYFFKATTGAVGACYNNSVAYGAIPADERAFGVNRNVTGGYDFVSIMGGVGRVTTPLVWPTNDPMQPVQVEYRIFEATVNNPVARLEVYLNQGLVLHDNFIAGNALGLPFNFTTKPSWLFTFNGAAGADVAATSIYYRRGPSLADLLN